MATVECKIFKLTPELRALFEPFTGISLEPDVAFIVTQPDGFATLTQEEFLELTKEYGFVLPQMLMTHYYDMKFVTE